MRNMEITIRGISGKYWSTS